MAGRKGFTLVELAIILVVLGLLAGMGINMLGVLSKRSQYQENRKRLEANVNSLVGYALTHERLPSDCYRELEYRRDRWGKDFLCLVASDLVTGDVCNATASSLEVIDENDDPSNSKEIAFIVVSGGPNYNIQTGNRTPIRIHQLEKPNVDDYPSDINRPEPYDDMVRYMTLNHLKALVCSP